MAAVALLTRIVGATTTKQPATSPAMFYCLRQRSNALVAITTRYFAGGELKSNEIDPATTTSVAGLKTDDELFHKERTPAVSLKCCLKDYTNQPALSAELTRKHFLNVGVGQYATFSTKSSTLCANKTESKASSAATADLFGGATNLGLFAKFKHMYKKYWYVLIPVHVVTSVGWLGAFYYLSKSGVDVPSLLHYIHLSETIIEKVQGSDMGHYAIAYLCYKVVTPLRYAVTLGGTTISIKYLVQAGHIKPIPTKHEFIKMYEDKKAERASNKAEQQQLKAAEKQQSKHDDGEESSNNKPK